MLVERARSEGLQLTGQGGLLQQLTKRVLESALKGEITDHLGYEKHVKVPSEADSRPSAFLHTDVIEGRELIVVSSRHRATSRLWLSRNRSVRAPEPSG
ncbi:hypothetical protein ACWGKT_47535, partial [Streptomyces sp. NPDC054794]